MESLLIAVISCERYIERREACRRSWVAASCRAGTRVVFVVGAPNARSARLGGDTLYVPCNDDYASLPQKTRLAAEWALQQGFTSLFKCDDDTFVHVPRLTIAAPSLAPFAGYVHPSGQVSGGAGYLLCGDAIRHVAAADSFLQQGAEDVLVTRVLQDHGIVPRHDTRFSPGNQVSPTVFNSVITAHYIDVESMVALQESLYSGPPMLFSLLDGAAGYGSIAIGGYRGYTAKGSARPRLRPELRLRGDEIISAHAPSFVNVHLGRPVYVRGLLDDDADLAGRPVTFWIDGQVCGTTGSTCKYTEWRMLEAGDHEFRTSVDGTNSSRYTVWQVSEEVPAPLFTVTRWTTGYGTIGLEGARGHSVGDCNRVSPPTDHEKWNRYQLISGHADFEVELVLHRATALVGFLDTESWFRPAEPVRFVADRKDVGLLYAGGQRTSEFLLQPGTHKLSAVRDNPCDVTRKYPVWAARPFDLFGTMRIVMPTSNRYTKIAAASLALLKRYWPDHPQVDVVRHEDSVDASPTVRQLYAGPQGEVPWTTAVRRYLETHNHDELVLLLLDDYGLCQPINSDLIERARQLMMTDLSISRFHLTWMKLPSRTPHTSSDGIIVGPAWAYTVNLQAAIWRRASLLRVLHAVGDTNCDNFELAGSQYVNKCERSFETEVYYDLPSPPVESLMLDSTDKAYWPLAYHNLMHRGKPDGRHEAFLRREGLLSLVK